MHQENSFKPNLLIRWGTLILAIFLAISLVRNISRVTLANSRIAKARENLASLEKENSNLQAQLKIADSAQFQEKEARDKLGLAKEGEIVMVLPPDDVLRSLAPKRAREDPKLPDPNWKQWLKLF